jgi:xylitol oxidase
MKADALWLSPSFGRDTVALHFTWKREDAVLALLPLIDAALAPFDARPHWGKVFEIDATRFDSLYPLLPAFRQLADRLDPLGKFRNDFLRRTIFAD